MTPRQLKYFVEIARTGSITTAAATLHIAQPALSHHIAAMEQELGVALLQRHARGVRLTAEGQRLWERAASILRQMERLGDDVREAGQSPRGIVRACVAGALSASRGAGSPACRAASWARTVCHRAAMSTCCWCRVRAVSMRAVSPLARRTGKMWSSSS